MIITANEYKEMGFEASDSALLEKCIKRAEYVLNGISGGRASIIALGKAPAADFVKQAAAFQTYAIYRSRFESRSGRNKLLLLENGRARDNRRFHLLHGFFLGKLLGNGSQNRFLRAA